jgi:hypothetical protein
MFMTGPVFRFIRKRRPLPPVEELAIPGRRTGLERRVLAQLIAAQGHLYVAEPSGLKSHWVDNLAAARQATVIYADGRHLPVYATELPFGVERDLAVDALPAEQPAPLRFLYRRAHRHVSDVGRVFRLEPS